MSNDAFHHQNEKVSHALKALVSTTIRRGQRSGHRKLEDFAPGILEQLHPSCLEKLGTTPQAQLEIMQMALPIAVDRNLIGHSPVEKSIFRTRRGVRARRAYLADLNQAKAKAKSKSRRGMPAFAR